MTKSFPSFVLYVIIFLCGLFHISAQDDFDTACQLAQPFCSDESERLTFPNKIGDLDGFGEIGCLNTTPNPSWYFLRIEESGRLIFDIRQWVDTDDDQRLDRNERQLDVDFIAWGPFETSFVVCDVLAKGCDLNNDGENIQPAECVNNADEPDFYINNLDNTNIIDCSYARQPEERIFVENFTIENAQQGEYYLVLITNFADESGVIQLEQTNVDEEEAGSTDCSILEPGIAQETITTCGAYPITIEGRFPGDAEQNILPAVTYQWSNAPIGSDTFTNIAGATLPFLEVNANGIYRLQGFDSTGSEVANSPDQVAVLDVLSLDFEVGLRVAEESFSGLYTITAEILVDPVITDAGFEDFEYLLEKEGNVRGEISFTTLREFQSSPVFENVPPGDYKVRARYRGCPDNEVVSAETLMILGYPKYFTPNGDGFHETWNLINPEGQVTALLYIFDRNGKLLKQIDPLSSGWDGTYNGSLMPSAQYWFKVEFNEPTDPNRRRRTFSGSFSLIR
ncbi:T9SS type B sorting domain-containing protein [Aquimarina sp. ERC-38]|uniref:T9SS type B sorting domain-containing protein n=1 Tax=Aquimarina sp. ERC-38 TaxID=2949996 RepID=UPI0022477E0B|nr:T9SS type B sorting domain-containing protein [Aquimarina sp. ERC-38]UZO80592.1 T9SS type B sorting domain-containing protein [Aquimarina sp. ERC-38]